MKNTIPNQEWAQRILHVKKSNCCSNIASTKKDCLFPHNNFTNNYETSSSSHIYDTMPPMIFLADGNLKMRLISW